jgi:hypothetical protein
MPTARYTRGQLPSCRRRLVGPTCKPPTQKTAHVHLPYHPDTRSSLFPARFTSLSPPSRPRRPEPPLPRRRPSVPPRHLR